MSTWFDNERHRVTAAALNPETAAATDRRRWLALIVVCVAQLMIVLDTTIVNVALPAIQHDLRFSQSTLTWVVDAFLLTFGGLLLLAGRLGDLLGRRRVFVAGLIIFTAASLLCGAAGSQALLIGARFAQGIGAALQGSVILAIIVTEFPGADERARAMSAYVFTAVAGGSLGLLAGGALTEALSWHWIFFVNLPIGVATLAAARAVLPADTVPIRRHGIDWLGSALVTGSLMAGTYAIVSISDHGWGSSSVLVPGAAALLLGAAFFSLEARIDNPIMPLRILRLRGLITSSVVRGFLVTGMFSTFFLGTIYLERVLGYTPLQAGLAFLPWTLTVAAFSSLGLTARLVARFGAIRVLVGGMVSVIAGLAVLQTTGTHSHFLPTVGLGYFLVGLGIGNAFMPLLTVAMADVPPADAGLASGIVNVSMQVAGALGLAVLGTIAASHTRALEHAGRTVDEALVAGDHRAFAIAAVAVAIGAVVAVAVLPRPSQVPAQTSDAAEPEADLSLEATEPEPALVLDLVG